MVTRGPVGVAVGSGGGVEEGGISVEIGVFAVGVGDRRWWQRRGGGVGLAVGSGGGVGVAEGAAVGGASGVAVGVGAGGVTVAGWAAIAVEVGAGEGVAVGAPPAHAATANAAASATTTAASGGEGFPLPEAFAEPWLTGARVAGFDGPLVVERGPLTSILSRWERR